MTKTALLIGSSFSASPLFFALKRRGLRVTVCGNLKEDPCHQYADASAYFDYSKKELLLDYVKSNGFDYIVPSCNDFAYVSGNWVAHELSCYPGWDTLETTTILHTKNAFRQFCETHKLPSPQRLFGGKAEDAKSAVGDFRYPLLVKPVDSFSGRGMTKVLSAAGLDDALAAATKESRSSEIVIEPFYDGNLHSHTAFIEDGVIFWDTFVDEFCTVYPYQVDCSNHPSRLSDGVRGRIRAAMQRLITAGQLADGLLHTQLIVSGEDFWIIEPMRRAPGDLYGQLIERSTGVQHNDMYVAKFLGERYAAPKPHTPNKLIGRHTISVKEPVTAAGGFHSTVKAKDTSYIPLKDSGLKLGVAPYDKLGILFFEFDSKDELFKASPHFAETVKVMPWEQRYG